MNTLNLNQAQYHLYPVHRVESGPVVYCWWIALGTCYAAILLSNLESYLAVHPWLNIASEYVLILGAAFPLLVLYSTVCTIATGVPYLGPDGVTPMSDYVWQMLNGTMIGDASAVNKYHNGRAILPVCPR
jgi:hypothetical protein